MLNLNAIVEEYLTSDDSSKEMSLNEYISIKIKEKIESGELKDSQDLDSNFIIENFDFSQFNLINVDLSHLNFSNCKFGKLDKVNFQYCDFDKCEFSSKVNKCDLRRAIFESCEASNITFEDCKYALTIPLTEQNDEVFEEVNVLLKLNKLLPSNSTINFNNELNQYFDPYFGYEVIDGHKYFNKYIEFVKNQIRRNKVKEGQEPGSFKSYILKELNLEEDSEKPYFIDLTNINIDIKDGFKGSLGDASFSPNYKSKDKTRNFIYRVANGSQKIANFDGCDFSYCDMRGFTCNAVSFKKVKFHHSNLSYNSFYTAPNEQQVQKGSWFNKIITWGEKQIYEGAQCDFTDADFYQTQLTNTVFTRGVSQRAKFREVLAVHTQFQHTDLTKAVFIDSELLQSNLNDAILDHATFLRTNIKQVQMKRVNLLKASLKQVSIVESNLEQSNFEQVKLKEIEVEDSNLKNIILSNAKVSEMISTNSDLSGLHVVNTQINDFKLIASSIAESSFSNSVVENLEIEKSNCQKVTFEQVKLIQSEVKDSDLRGIILNSTNVEGMTCNNTDLSELQANNATINKLHLDNSSIADSQFNQGTIQNSKIENSNCQNAVFEQVEVTKSDFQNSDMQAAKFNQSDMVHVKINECKADHMVLKPNIHENLEFNPTKDTKLETIVIGENVNLEEIKTSKETMAFLKLSKQLDKENRLEKEITFKKAELLSLEDEVIQIKYGYAGVVLNHLGFIPEETKLTLLKICEFIQTLSNPLNKKTLITSLIGMGATSLITSQIAPILLSNIWTGSLVALAGIIGSYKLTTYVSDTYKLISYKPTELEKKISLKNQEIENLTKEINNENLKTNQLRVDCDQIENQLNLTHSKHLENLKQNEEREIQNQTKQSVLN